ncbi:suppressor of fused domain protein [Streptomyces sp. DSM 42041]|uniref:Suppressor of fused domain protein n=1 Tax=Streptomyces hazeniae TaxID=3075538 RepID=A0ABU2NPD6_9ACTN|nr:suppressor of fused domain protein [Streptomyces sp. DSM 42041]MDT0378640.1 suppressor of fused domain protein [Streptomyces sp. DSM 42041]
MTDSDEFGGLTAHVVRHLGPAKRRWTPPDDRGYGVTLHYPQRQRLPIVSAVTAGLHLQEIEAPEPIELICTLQTGQEAEAVRLVNVAAQYVLGEGGEERPPVGQDRLVGGEAPLIPGTAIHGLLFGAHPVFREVSPFLGEDGSVALRFLTVLPLTEGDLRFLVAADVGAGRQARLWERWHAQKIEFWDVHRRD